MPQLTQLPDIFWSQLFWLAVVFGLIFFVVGLGMVPKVEATVEARGRKVADDLALAERARAEADESEAAWRSRMDESRAEALRLAQASKQAAARDSEAQVKAADAGIGERTRAAEARIAEAGKAAMAGIETVAAEAAQEMIAKLAGLSVAPERAAQAVKAVLNG